ncbi:hypothetical protein AAMO2058_001536100 [Amorphochlora amoebiformis]
MSLPMTGGSLSALLCLSTLFFLAFLGHASLPSLSRIAPMRVRVEPMRPFRASLVDTRPRRAYFRTWRGCQSVRAETEGDELISEEDRDIAIKLMSGELEIKVPEEPEMADLAGVEVETEESLQGDGEDDEFLWEEVSPDQAIDVNTALEMMDQSNLDYDEAEEENSVLLELDDKIIGVDDSEEFAVAAAKAMSDVKAENISIVYVREIRSYTSYVVIGTVFSRPQTDAVKKRVSEAAERMWVFASVHQYPLIHPFLYIYTYIYIYNIYI